MELHELTHRQPVIASVFGAVSEVRTITPPRGRNEGKGPADLVGRIAPEPFPGVPHELHAEAHECGGRTPVDAPVGKPLERCLIGCADPDVRAGGEVVVVHLLEELGCLHEHLRGPERIMEIRAASLQLGRNAAIEDDHAVAIEDRGDGILYVSPLTCWCRGRTTFPRPR